MPPPSGAFLDDGPASARELFAGLAETGDGFALAELEVLVNAGRIRDLTVTYSDPTMQRLFPGLRPGARLSQLLPPGQLHRTLWRVWSEERHRLLLDNRSGDYPALLTGVVLELVQVRDGTRVLWLATDRSEREHWYARAKAATAALQEELVAAQSRMLRAAGQLFELAVAWTVIREDGEGVDAVVTYLNQAAQDCLEGRVRVGMRLSQLLPADALQSAVHLFAGVLEDDPGGGGPAGAGFERVFGPDDFAVHLLRVSHGRVRLFALDVDTVVGLVLDESELADAAAQARQALLRLARSRDDEGRFLAARLHDGPLQAQLSARWILEEAHALLDGPAADLVGRAQVALDTAEATLRAEIFALSPPSLETTGVFVAIAELAERLRSDQCEVLMTLDGDSRLARADETLLVRCIQELLRNADYHAGASVVTVSATADDEVVSVTVADDGTGFDPEDPEVWSGRTHFGLSSCRLLLERAGGGLALTSGGDGTVVRCWLPQPTIAVRQRGYGSAPGYRQDSTA
jgi:signal transduction histidine kinase